jgi:hypothetical protein
MAKKKSIDELSAEELYALAQEREQQEAEAQREAVRQQVDELKVQRKALIAEHKKELAALDKEIRKLGGRTRSRRGVSSMNVTDVVLGIVQAAGEISTKDIRAQLDAQGIEANNLSQTLAYLKRQGRVQSPGRSLYAAA